MEVFIGTVCAFGFNFQPVGWLFCQGQLLSISQYQVMFALMGTTYGGDGVNTFAIPNLQNRAVVHEGQGPGTNTYVIGQTGGNDSVTLTAANLPAHTHSVSFTINGLNGRAASPTPANQYPAEESSGNPYSTPPAPSGNAVTMGPITQPTLALTGGNQPISIQSPSLAINYCIATVGIYPSRN